MEPGTGGPGGPGTERGGGCGGCFLYYAYGSNLLRERLLLSSPSAVLRAVARLQVR
uniref:Gamma-glutamylcyclotransferase n=1 Tax=Otus sunia TaxID=257818 RepID=A0A8C8AHE7_9STRI